MHFLGRKSNNPENPDYVPSVFSYCSKAAKDPKHKLKRFERLQIRRKLETVKSAPEEEITQDHVEHHPQQSCQSISLRSEIGKHLFIFSCTNY